VEWRRTTETAEFKNMLKAKRRFILPATLFFIVYYFALPVLVGYAPALMSTKVLGVVKHRISLRALAVFHGVGYRSSLSASCVTVRQVGAAHHRKSAR